MSVGERYHKPLRETFLKLQGTYGENPTEEKKPEPKKTKKARETLVEDKYLLKIAVMSINSTIGPEGICPTLLLYGAMPKLLDKG